MKITLQTLKFTESPELKDFVNAKVSKLFHKFPQILRVDITLKIGAKNNPTNKWCELYVSLSGENKFTKRNSESFEESILKATTTMENILAKIK